MSLQEAQKHFEVLKNNVEKGQYQLAERALTPLKKIMLDLDSLPPILANTSPTAKEERQLFQAVLEYSVLLSVYLGDKQAFQKYLSSLQPYYHLYRRVKEEEKISQVTVTVLGLHLLFLLVENRLADFHCQIELLSDIELKHPMVSFSTQLEKYLVVGAYDQVLAAAQLPPSPAFAFFLTSLQDTVRMNICEGLSRACPVLNLKEAAALLMFSTADQVCQFLEERCPDWIVGEGEVMRYHVGGAGGEGEGGSGHRWHEELAPKLIAQTLSYAIELERIV